MKIIKTLFKKEIDIQPRELREFWDCCHPVQYVGFFRWIKKEFGLNILLTKKTEESK